MATYIKTLKEDNGDITYPQTTTDAVLTTSGTTLETELGKCVKAEEIGSTADITPTITTAMIKDSAVTTAKIADSAVTSNKIDWTTLTNNSSYFYIGNILVQFGYKSFGTQSFSEDWWGNMRRSATVTNTITFPVAFKSAPSLSIHPCTSPVLTVSSFAPTATTSGNLVFVAPQSATGSYLCDCRWIAIGIKA